MKKYINDKSPFPQSLGEIEGHLIDFEGHDRPRYIMPFTEEAGYLGIDDWGNYWQKAVATGESDGTLEDGKFYSIVVVPVKTNISAGGLPIYGEATAPSIPFQTTGADKSILFNIPIHEQTVIKECGSCTAGGAGALTDSGQAWIINSLVGMALKNVETGLSAPITANTATAITASGVDFTTADRYQVLSSAIQLRQIYAAQMDAETDVLTAAYYLSGSVKDNTTATFELKKHFPTATQWDFDAGYTQPPNANCVGVVSGVVFAGGGILEETGVVAYEGTKEIIQASSSPLSGVSVSITDDDYESAGTSRIVRYTLDPDLDQFEKAVAGSYVTIESADDEENNVEDARVLRVGTSDSVSVDDEAESRGLAILSGATQIATFANDGALGDFITISESTAGFNDDDFTLEIVADLQDGEPKYYAGKLIGGSLAWQFSIEEDSLIFFTSGGTGTAAYVTSADWTRGWQKLSIEKEGTVVKFYSDGTLLTSTGSAAATLGTGSGAVRLCGVDGSASGSGAGAVASIAYKGATDEAVWIFDAGSGTSIADATGNGNTGTLTTDDGAAFWAASKDFASPVAIGWGGDGSIGAVSIKQSAPVEDWAITCTIGGAGATFTVVGSVSGAQANLTSGTPYTNAYFLLSIEDGTSDWVAGNALTFSVVGSVINGRTWIEVLNNDGVVAEDVSMKVTLTPNYIQGTGTIFSEGLTDAQFQIISDKSSPYAISWVDPVNQRLGLASLYEGFATAASEEEYRILSDYSLYYSDLKNPHRWRPGEIIDIGDSITGIESLGDNVIVFCKNSLWRIPVESLGSAPTLISDNVRCPAQFSVAKGERVLMFYDGTGLSITDGVVVTSVTAFKARDYLANINKVMERNIRTVYDRERKRFEVVFPMGTDAENNYGMYITEGSWNCYPFSRPDVNAIWAGIDQGNRVIYHGTSGAGTTSGLGMVWKHEGPTDGDPGDNAYLFYIREINDQVVSVHSEDGETDAVAGDIVTLYPIASGEGYRQMVIKSISQTSGSETEPYEYDIEFDDIYDLSPFGEGDILAFALIPFDYGVKWTDFSSPQYLHQVRSVHIEVEDFHGVVYLDHYKDMGSEPVSTAGYTIYPSNTKLVVPFRGGKSYKYGFRLRGLSRTQVKVTSFEILFDTTI